MSAAKYFLIGGAALFSVIGWLGYVKKQESAVQNAVQADLIQEIAIPSAPEQTMTCMRETIAHETAPVEESNNHVVVAQAEEIPAVDRISELFALDSSKLPIVETISYTSRVPWIKGRPAWIADYASYYNTSRHFIARSLNRKADYVSQKVSLGDRFNVFKKDKNIQFHLLVDLSSCRMWFYYIDLDQNERVLLKTYKVGLGRLEASKKSGCLTPVGKYLFGDKIAIYKPGVMGFFQDQKTEMVRVFGTRWIPFGKEIEGCTEPAKGLGFHGAPWTENPETHLCEEDKSKIGKYDSDGCIRLTAEDIEEVFAIVITKPTVVEIVKNMHEAKLPGIEK